ncbi:BRCA1-A complex subunit Abraxas 1 isoform X1 [Latimeria chalumnae]|uniref:BRCA1-A complex subunit Abraxas 1 n=2 Tax=Latimeria chalumnae TaxID=7897 RepID=H3ATM0_LATCH|nr:PREDICTED: BRCA1-A complex subunit Abraxas isoform X1 [Latimeria chalumnae]|eukprot:XP_005999429.1 PREDICTED: BRCA1-A complex subunit Abraxas isoform X1 [Latimeria chalumnae]
MAEIEGESVTAHISGFVLGALNFHHFNSNSDTEGFLLGDVKAEAKNSITDSQMDDVEVIYTIDIQKYIPCYQLHSFYSSTSEINEQALNKILSSHKKSVIGWYKFRRNTAQTMTFRERVLHKNLQKYFSDPELVFLLLTTSVTTETSSTHRLEYALYKPKENLLHRAPLVVTNLGMSEQQDYKTFSGSSISSAFNRAVKKHRSDFFNGDGTLKEVNRINEVYSTLQEELKGICIKVEDSERSVENLLADVDKLKRKVAERKQQQAQNSDEKQADHLETEENVLLCQALQTFFPASKLFHSRAVSLTGWHIPKYCCNTDHRINIMDQLTLILEETDFTETTRQAGKRKAKSQQDVDTSLKKRRSLNLRNRVAKNEDNNGSNKEKVVALSGVESEDDLFDPEEDAGYSQSPTF